MFNKCPFCGKENIIVNSFSEKYDTRFEYFCVDCRYVWYKQSVSSCNIDTSDYWYGLACQVED